LPESGTLAERSISAWSTPLRVLEPREAVA
jgi:hypothetical protein